MAYPFSVALPMKLILSSVRSVHLRCKSLP
jgi:hypothetical protein